jgi:phosphate transport system substrate-binding protein
MVAPGMVATLNGAEITVSVNDMGVYVDQAQVIATDIIASNGVIHLIDSVIVPTIELPEVLAADVTGDIVVAGSSTVFPVTQYVVDQFIAEGYAGTISNDSIGSGAGIERFCAAENASDIANASRAIRDSEVESCITNNGRQPFPVRVGDDGIAVVVNPANEFVSDLTLEQLALAFGSAVTWQDVDPSFPAEEIVRYSPGTDSGTFDFFVESVFDEDSAPILSAGRIEFSEDDNVLLEGVANDVNAIGYFGYAYYVPNSDKLKIVAIDGILATPESVAGGDYALARPLFVYGASSVMAEKPQVAEFLKFYLNNVEAAIEATGYFPASPFSINIAKLLLLSAEHEAMMGGM